MTEQQLFTFDTWGFLTVDDAITPEQAAELKATANERGSGVYTQLAKDGGFWSQAYFDLLDVPAVSSLLEVIFGDPLPSGLPPFRIDHINVHTHGAFNENFAGGVIHGGNGRLLTPNRPRELVNVYYDRDPDSGVFSNGLVAVAFELEGTVCNGGGFGCLAGSHKSPFLAPEDWRDLSRGVHPMVTRVPARAGTAIIFTEALQHVTLPWTAPSTRTTLFYKYTRVDEVYCSATNFFDPSDADGWEHDNERTRCILSAPPQDYLERRSALARQEKQGA